MKHRVGVDRQVRASLSHSKTLEEDDFPLVDDAHGNPGYLSFLLKGLNSALEVW